MARSRPYTMGFNNVTVSAVQDLFAIYAGSAKAFEVLMIQIGQVTQTSIGSARLRLRTLPATVTTGSGGSAGTLSPVNSADTAATITGRINDTTQATTSGTAIDRPDTWQLLNNYIWWPANRESSLIVLPSQAFIVSLDTALASLVCSGTLTVAELF